MKKQCKRIASVALALVLALCLGTGALAAEFAPDDGFATRGDMVRWLYSDLGQVFPAGKADVTFTDVSEADGTAEAAAWAAGLGIVKGYGDGRFGPDDLVTREQAATMCYRLAQHLGQGFQGMWMFYLNYADAAEISDWANEAVHWVVMKGVMPGVEGDDSPERLAPKDYIGVNELPMWMRALDDALDTELVNDGYTLTIPVMIADLLNTELPADVPEGTLFNVAEQASIDAAKAKGYEEAGMGWLFAIRKISEAEAHEMLCYDMSGRSIFAKDDEGNYFLFATPTDVRFDRATTEEMMADSELWGRLNEWASSVKDRFVNVNGLTPVHFGNSDVEIYLNRAAYDKDANYTLSTLEFLDLKPFDVDPKPFVERLLNGLTIAYADIENTPDGEYAVLRFPDEDTRFDFFHMPGGENYIRRVSGEYETLYLATYEDGETLASAIVDEWYDALAVAQGLK